MAMANEGELNTLLKAYSKSLTPELIAEAIEKGDGRVIRYLNKHIKGFEMPETVPGELVDAATLFSAQKALDVLGTTRDNRNPTAIQWEKEAFEALDDYIEAYTDDNDATNRGAEIQIFNV